MTVFPTLGGGSWVCLAERARGDGMHGKMARHRRPDAMLVNSDNHGVEGIARCGVDEQRSGWPNKGGKNP